MSRNRDQIKADLRGLLPFLFTRRDEADQLIDDIIDVAVEEAIDILREAPPK